jgi:anaerobic selenocysteine-containing dehydrogenase
MDRRNFFKIVSSVSAGVATTSCGKKSDALIPLLVADHEVVPGEEQWHPSVCSECAGGCGVIARVMEGEHVIERGGRKFRERIACIKKLEGNPLDPVSGGRLCARGHAALQSLYNPDRVTGPMRRSAERGEAKFAAISWDEAVGFAAEKLAKARAADPNKILFLSSLQGGTRSLNVQRFLEALGAPPALTCSPANLSLERKAAEIVFGWKGLPRYDLQRARYALGVGADFLEGWASPVYYARQFGHFRQGRLGVRGRLVQAESRLSLTAASADEWLPLGPGSEPFFLLALARFLVDEKLAKQPEKLPPTTMASVQAANLADCIRQTGLEEKRFRRIARELGESESPLLIAGASVIHTNSMQALVTSHYVNVLLGNIEQPGGVFPPANASENHKAAGIQDAVKGARILLLDGENPVYSLPAASEFSHTLRGLESIVSFGSFIDDSGAYADLILPDHNVLESDTAIVPAVSPQASITVARQFVRPLHNTRALSQTLQDIAHKMNVALEPVTPENYVKGFLPAGTGWDDVVRRGGLWLETKSERSPVTISDQKLESAAAVFAGAPDRFPLLFQPYLSLQYHDGRGANLPWMQELPDPASSAMWDLPAEIDPQVAAKINIKNGDRVKVESENGSLETIAYVHPAALPGVVSMGIGQGHKNYGRFASGRGANPLSILAPVVEGSTGSLAFGATRVRITRLNEPGELIQFSPRDREQGPWGYR